MPAPTVELGSMLRQNAWSAPALDERELQRDLTYPQSVRTYGAMLNDAQVDGLYRGATLPIRSYDWRLDPNGAPPEMVAQAMEDFGLDQVGVAPGPKRRSQQRFTLDRHMEDALRGVVTGHYFFEQLYEAREDGPAVNGGVFFHLRKLSPRPPATIMEIAPARDGGLAHIKVPALNPDPSFFGQGVKLPVDRLVAYVWDREGANWKGRSMLRSSYRPWKLKDRVMRVGAINIERAGGVPYIEAPEGATAQQMAVYHQLASEFRIGEGAGAALPHGATLKFASAAGGDQAINFVRLQNEEMSRAWLMMFMQLGQTETGSRALGESFIDYFAMAQQAIAGWFRDVFNEHVIEDWVDQNYGTEAQYAPRLVFAPHGDPAAALGDAVEEAQSAGALPDGSVLAAAVEGHRSRHPRPVPVRAAAGDVPEGARQPTPKELAAGVDFAAMQAQQADATDALVEAWAPVQAAQAEELTAQIAAATSVAAAAGVTATVAGTPVIAAAMAAAAAQGIAAATAEAASQAFALPAPDTATLNAELADHAEATATVLTRSLAQAAANHATALHGPDLNRDALAELVAKHLDGLSDATLREHLGAAVHGARNQGRFAAMDGWGSRGTPYASELLDASTCSFCADVDGTAYPDMDAARGDYPFAGYLGCEGRGRCRGTVVTVANEV